MGEGVRGQGKECVDRRSAGEGVHGQVKRRAASEAAREMVDVLTAWMSQGRPGAGNAVTFGGQCTYCRDVPGMSRGGNVVTFCGQCTYCQDISGLCGCPRQ